MKEKYQPASVKSLKIPGGLLLVLVLIATLVFLRLDIRTSYEPQYLLVVLNTLLIFIPSVVISILAVRSFLFCGVWPVIWLSSGTIAFGIGTLVGAVLISLSRVNMAISASNLLFFIGAIGHSIGAFFILSEITPLEEAKKRLSALLYISFSMFLICALIIPGVATGIFPDFFIQGQGGLPLRQFITGISALLFLFSGAVVFREYRRKHSDFFFWYSLGLMFLGLGMIAILLQHATGTPANWTGRAAQMLGMLYLLGATLIAVYEAKTKKTSIGQVLAGLFVRSAENVNQAEQRFNIMFEKAHIGIGLADKNAVIVESNTAMQKMLGYTDRELSGMHARDFTFPDDMLIESSMMNEIAQGKRESYDIEKRCIRKDGNIIWVRMIGSALRTKKGDLINGLAMMWEITDQKTAEDKVRTLMASIQEEKERLSALLNSMPDEVWFADTDKNFTITNSSALREFAFTKPGSINIEGFASELEVYRPDGSPRPVDESPPLRALKGETVKNLEEIIRTPVSGEMRFRQVSAAPVKNPEGKIVGSVSVVRDITEMKKTEEALRESEKKYHTLFSSMSEGFVLHNVILDAAGKPYDYRFVEVNRAFEKSTGLYDLSGKTVREVIPDTDDNWIDRFGKTALTGEPAMFEQFNASSGKWYEIYAYTPSKNQIAAIFVDITERKQYQQMLSRAKDELETKVAERTDELKESEDKYRVLVENASEAVVIVQDGKLKFFNQKAMDISGYSREELESIEFSELVHIDDRLLIAARYEALLRGENIPMSYDLKLNTRDKSEKWLSLNAVLLQWEGRPAVLCLLPDVTQRRNMEEELKVYARRITQIQEEERKKIAYELHDNTAQYLYILKTQLDSLLESGSIQSSKVLERLKYLEKDAGLALEEIRRYSHELRPAVLDNLGLKEAMEQLAEDINKSEKIVLTVSVTGEEPELSDEKKLALFRIVQEAINNIIKHSRSSEAAVAIVYTEKSLNVEIKDSGIGFNIQAARTRAQSQGSMGLMSMQERANLIGAELEICSESGQGTTVRIVLLL